MDGSENRAQIRVCQYCEKEFTRRDSFHEHLLIHIGPRHKCSYCSKEFVQRSNLTRHLRIHTGEKPYKCIYCDKSFSDKGAQNSHIQVHTREGTCSCPYCGRTFLKQQKLTYHMRIHTGQLISCEVCGKSFTHNYALKQHSAIHTTEIRVACSLCGKLFKNKRYLVKHLKIFHEKPKIYVCSVCPKSFSQPSRLKAHLEIHGGVREMKCLLCEKSYTNRRSIRMHLLENHQISHHHPQYKNCFHIKPASVVGLKTPIKSEDPVTEIIPATVVEVDYNAPKADSNETDIGAENFITVKVEPFVDSDTEESVDMFGENSKSSSNEMLEMDLEENVIIEETKSSGVKVKIENEEVEDSNSEISTNIF